jgi:alkyl sulfatase BDS1-like metallo-beta-lactamase superfamily hydrolase
VAVPRYLTQEWLDAAQRAVDGDATLADATKDVQLTVQQVVTGGPDGDAAYHVAIDDGAVRVLTGEANDATVTFTLDWDTATAVSRGELSAQGAFMTGRIRVRGDLPKLVEHGSVFGGVDDVLADLRAQTTY